MALPTELRHAGLEGHPGAGRGFLENHRQYLAAQRFMGLAALVHGLEFDAAPDQVVQLFRS
jgi:hypothetical protein